MANKKDQFPITKKTLKLLCNREKLLHELLEGKLPQEILGFSEPFMDRLYLIAYSRLSDKKFKEAIEAFTFLVTINPNHSEYWMGLGTALQYCHAYEEAIDAFELAAIHNLENPWPYFYLSKCLFAIHDRNGALLAIELAMEYAKQNENEYLDLLVESKKAKKILSNS